MSSADDFEPPVTVHEERLQALRALVAGDPFFNVVDLDDPEPNDWQPPASPLTLPADTPAVTTYCTVQDGPRHPTRDGGAENDWEMELEATVAFAVQSQSRRARRAYADQAAARISNLIRNNRQLGLADPQTYAEIGATSTEDKVAVKATAPVMLLTVTVTIQYVAESEAG